ncbi:MAG TPA: hypothetical protein VHA82_11940 [Ramlibacter sp.]|uniref:hypothetical protein n=1 Tax=Ramlibacter sp. TaxID=1917967 RepID=UPI002B6EB93C|nr:hypothetical protein [Ramlibacter sp.]HVZ44513.1 hypothetical protein [Ramlibacter sp.]
MELFVVRAEIELRSSDRDPTSVWGTQLVLASFCSDEHTRLTLNQLTTAFDEATCESILVEAPSWVPSAVARVLQEHRNGTIVALALPDSPSAGLQEVQWFVDVLRTQMPSDELHFVAIVSSGRTDAISGVNHLIRLGGGDFGSRLFSLMHVLSSSLAPTMIIDIDWWMLANALGDWENPSFFVEAIWPYGGSELIFESIEAVEQVRWSSAVVAVPQCRRESMCAAMEFVALVPMRADRTFVSCLTSRFLRPWSGPQWAAPVRMLCRPE